MIPSVPISAAAGALLCAVVLASAGGLAQEAAPDETPRAATFGNPEAGRTYAMDVCAQCHAVERGDRTSPVAEATPFQVIATTPGMSQRALTVWLTTFHPARTMSAIVMDQDTREDVIAYILGLEKG